MPLILAHLYLKDNRLVRMERLSLSNSVVKKEEILKVLQYSMIKGSVVGISIRGDGHNMYLTSVDQIIESEHGVPIIVIKDLDLLGVFINQNRIALNEIVKVRMFNALYDDRLPATIRKIAFEREKEYPVKIRKRERIINEGDLNIILIRTIDTGYRISIRLTNATILDKCYVRDFNTKNYNILVSCEIEQGERNGISLRSIKAIEFESFFNYKGLLSKVFLVNKR